MKSNFITIKFIYQFIFLLFYLLIFYIYLLFGLFLSNFFN
nr:MAG TPA: hypothetical protein [Caudoviricetes sp.]